MNLSRPYPWAALMIFLIVLIGFWPTYYGPMLNGELDSRGLVHLHNAVFMGWVLLLMVQVSFVANDRTDLHRKKVTWLYITGLLILVVSGLRMPLSQTDAWLSIARVLSGSS